MPDYEVRLYDFSNKLILIYITLCPNDEAAEKELGKFTSISHARYDIWRDDELIKSSDTPRDRRDGDPL